MKHLTLAAVLVLTFSAAESASEPRVPSPLDARVVHRAGGAIAVETRRADPEPFRARRGGDWTLHVDRRTGVPTLLSGSGVPLLPEAAAAAATLDDLDGAVRRFLDEERALFGSWSDLLELDREASVRIRPEQWQLVYRQRLDGVRVENARLDVQVVLGRLVLIGAEHWARPAGRAVPSLDAAAARSRVDAWLGDDAARLLLAEEPRLTLLAAGDDDAPALRHVLAWRLVFDEVAAPRRWVGEVDARDGSVVAFYEGTQYAAVRGGVFPLSPDGDCANGGCEVAGMPMPYADATETGQVEQFGDPYGNLACFDPGAATETNLVGKHVRIVDTCGAASQWGTCGTGLDLGMKAGDNCAVAPGASPGNTSAARTAFFHMNRVAQIARFHDPANTWLNGRLTVNVNVSGTCNANWTGSVINMFGAGNGCNNTGENAGILVHEWGHGYDANDGGGMDRPSEAYSDIVNILATRASCQGHGTYNDGRTCSGYGDTCLTCTGFREFDWDKRQSHTPSTPNNFAHVRCAQDFGGGPCKREPHCESYISSEAIYDLAARDLPASGMDAESAWQLVDRLWFQTRPGSGGNAYACTAVSSDSCSATSWYQRMRVADDDDGNLANGTPHAASLFAAFKRHALACGAVGDATNQNHTSCAALAAPVVTRTSSPAGVDLSWSPVAGAGSYRVYRGELGCNRQQVPIATRTAAQTTYLDDSADSGVLRHYRVQAFGSSSACASPVSSCVGAPAGSRLKRTADRMIDDDGIPEPGETFALALSLANDGGDPATSTSGTLSLVGPAHVRLLDASIDWPTIASGGSAESASPHAQIVVLPQATCGQVVTLDLAGAASNSAPFQSRIELPMGATQRDYAEGSIVPIPYLTTTPAVKTFTVSDAATIADLDLTLDVFHQTPTQIVVELTSPSGTTVRLHDRGPAIGHGVEGRFDRDLAPSGPGTMADFAGEPLQGTWTLSVSDLDPAGETTDGYIRASALNATILGGFGCEPKSCPDPIPTGSPVLQVRKVDDGAQLDLVLSWSAAAGSGYHVLQSTGPAFDGAVDLVGNPTSATTWTIENGGNTTPAVTFFQVKAVNSCHHEGP